MTTPMIITLAITVFMIYLIMTEKIPFGAPPLLACVLLVVTGVADAKSAFAGFSNGSVIMIACFMVLMAAIRKTSLMYKFRDALVNFASKGGYKSYAILCIMVTLVTSVFGTGVTAYYVLVLSFISTMPYNKELPPSKLLMPLAFCTNHPLIPVNVAMHYSILISVLQSCNVVTDGVSVVRFAGANAILSVAFLIWCLVAYKLLPDHEIAAATEDAIKKSSNAEAMPKWKEKAIYIGFLISVVSMLMTDKIGDAGLVMGGLVSGILLFMGVISFTEVRENIGSPIILMTAGVIGIADALGNTGVTPMIGEAVANMLGTNVNPFLLIFAFCVLTSSLACFTGSSLGTVYVFAPIAINVLLNLGLNPTAAAAAIIVSAWNGHYMPIDGMPAMIMGMGKYKLTEFWKFTVPMYFIRLLALTVGCMLMFPM